MGSETEGIFEGGSLPESRRCKKKSVWVGWAVLGSTGLLGWFGLAGTKGTKYIVASQISAFCSFFFPLLSTGKYRNSGVQLASTKSGKQVWPARKNTAVLSRYHHC